MAQITLGPNRAYPALPTVGNDLESHSRALEAIIEAIQIHERRTGDTLDSFVRVGELETLGLVEIDGRIVSDISTEESTTHHHDSVYLRLDGTNDPVTGSVSFQGGITVQGSFDVTSATFTGLSSADLSDVDSIGMLDEAEVVSGAWRFNAAPLLGNSVYLQGRNLADTASYDLIGINAADWIEFGDTSRNIQYDGALHKFSSVIEAFANIDIKTGNNLILGAATVTETKVGNWDTAFGWGNHAIQNYVQTNQTETITGTWTLDGSVTTSDFGTGGRVKDGTDTSRPLGFNVMPIYEPGVNDSFDLAHNGMIWNNDTISTQLTFTCPNDATIPQGATYCVTSDSSGGVIIAEGTGVTLRLLKAGANPATGNVSMEIGGIMTVYKYSDTEWWCWGSQQAATNPLNSLVEDTTPQLGGTLDANGFTIDMGTNIITDTKVGQWDTAYGWGNHATAGYAVAGGAYHDGFSDYVANEHINWTNATSSFATTGLVKQGTDSSSTVHLQMDANSGGFVIEPGTSIGGWARGHTVKKQSDGSTLGGAGWLGANEALTRWTVGFDPTWWTNYTLGVTSSAVIVNGNITVTGTVDGVDVAALSSTVTTLDAAAAKTADNETITGTWTLDGAVTGSDFGTGGKVKDGTDTARPIGFNVMPIYEIDASDTYDLAHNGMLWHRDAASGAHTHTVPNDSTIPVGATYVIVNESSSGSLAIGPASGVTLVHFEGVTRTNITNPSTLSVDIGGVATVVKYTDTKWFIWGIGLS